MLIEAIVAVGDMGIYLCDHLFQHLMSEVQRGLEDAVMGSLEPDARRTVLCHRGTLDSLAYWLDRGRPEEKVCTFADPMRAGHYVR